MTLAVRPRNHENAVKSMTWRRFSAAVSVAQKRSQSK
jgi:hypothetical protein